MAYEHDVFISYAREDEQAARHLRSEFLRWGVKPFFDREDLLPGEEWKLAISRAIRSSRHFIALLSKASVGKEGYVQKEIREALEVVQMMPRGRIYVIPVRLDDCRPSHPELDAFNWVDLFDGFSQGVVRILRVVKPDAATQAEAQAADAVTSAPPKEQPVTRWNEGALALALAPEPVSHVQKIRDRLLLLQTSSAINAIAAVNLTQESNLPVEIIRQLLAAIADASLEVSSIRRAIIEVCRQHVLQGPVVKLGPDTVFGAILPLDALVANLYANHAASSMSSVRLMVQEMVDRSGTEHRHFADIYFTRYVSWAIFAEDGGAPFPSVTSADHLACVVGRNAPLAGEPLLLIEYSLPSGISPRVPTFCDAYASEIWGYWFRVPPAHLPWGITVPRDDCANEKGVPEVVHRPISFDHVRSIRALR